ncbi:hypothetical protein [Aeromonas phage AerS_266]|nr:hypothetical protein [Aeromonas phage AerS_266]
MKESIRKFVSLQDLIDQFFCVKINGGVYVSKSPLKFGEPIVTLEQIKFIEEFPEFHFSVIKPDTDFIFWITPESHYKSILFNCNKRKPISELLIYPFLGFFKIIRDDLGSEDDIRKMTENVFVNDNRLPF